MKINEIIVGKPCFGIPLQVLQLVTSSPHQGPRSHRTLKQIVLVMNSAFIRINETDKRKWMMRAKLTTLIMLLFLLQVSAASRAQITLKERKAPLQKVLKTISKQSGYDLIYSVNDLKDTKPVNVEFTNVSLEKALELCFSGQPLLYEVADKTVMIKRKEGKGMMEKIIDYFQSIEVKGKIVDENGKALAGASVVVKGTKQTAISGSDGTFTLKNVADDAIIVISFIGHQTRELKAAMNLGDIKLEMVNGQLDQVQIIAYGTTTRRLNTGSVGSVSAKDIANQPVSNPLATLIGRVPGLVVTQQSGVPGSSFSIQIRGRNSIAQGSQPLILIDGIPFAAGNENMQLINSAVSSINQGSGLSPFNTINPADIESIEILKDADATAIYGSRGANGVVLVTTKKGKAGKTQISANFNQGITHVGKLLPLLNTEQYIAMRKEAFANAGTTPTISNAPDLLVFDQNRYTDYQKEFLGGTGNLTNANLSISGGSNATQFLLSGTFNKETSVFPGNLPNQRGSMLANINHTSEDKRFNVAFSGSFTSSENKSPSTDLTLYSFLSPNSPEFFDQNGKLQWSYNGVIIQNPYSFLRESYRVRTNNLSGSMTSSYKIWKGLSIKTLLGYNQQFTNEQKLSPAEAKSPTSATPGHTAIFGKNQFSSWNIEPQLEYSGQLLKGKLTALLGTTFLSRSASSLTVDGLGYGSEALLENFDAATAIDASSVSSLYRYQAIFARLNYNIEDKYLLNFTGRRDGSSRFGPGKQFANFGAAGAAWIFSSEKWMQNLQFLSFGKLRGSYGITGNDQIGDYQFVETWRANPNTYVGAVALNPYNLYNDNYAWEKNNKFEAAIDLGFWKDRILFSAGYFQNRSSNQLIRYRVPYITGFSSVIANFPATVENKGWEFTLSGTPVRSGLFRWDSSINITLPKNILVKFPGIETSSYYSLYLVGKSLNSIYKYTALEVNPQTGYLSYYDKDGNNATTVNDYQYNGNTDPKFYGGWQNTISFSGIELQFFLDFKKQIGRNLYSFLYNGSLSAGTMINQPIVSASRWKAVGDIAELPKVMPSSTGTIANNLLNSNFSYSNQSFVRLRNISVSYSLNSELLTKIGARSTRIYLLGQNLLTISKTKGYDPETQNPTVLPVMQSYTIGLQISY